MGATPLAVALTLSEVHGDARFFIAALVYPVGFIAVILGRAQLFTENTLYPVMVAFEDRGAIRPTARLWAIMFSFNIAGGALFALLAVDTDALPDKAVPELRSLGERAVDGSFGRVFFGAIVAGWLLALVAWLVEASETAIGQFFAIWIVTLLIGLGDFSHCVATTLEVFAVALRRRRRPGRGRGLARGRDGRERDRRGAHRHGAELRAGAAQRLTLAM